MRRILAEALIIVVETVLVLALVAAFGMPGGRRAKAVTEAAPAAHCIPVDDEGPFGCAMANP